MSKIKFKTKNPLLLLIEFNNGINIEEYKKLNLKYKKNSPFEYLKLKYRSFKKQYGCKLYSTGINHHIYNYINLSVYDLDLISNILILYNLYTPIKDLRLLNYIDVELSNFFKIIYINYKNLNIMKKLYNIGLDINNINYSIPNYQSIHISYILFMECSLDYIKNMVECTNIKFNHVTIDKHNIKYNLFTYLVKEYICNRNIRANIICNKSKDFSNEINKLEYLINSFDFENNKIILDTNAATNINLSGNLLVYSLMYGMKYNINLSKYLYSLGFDINENLPNKKNILYHYANIGAPLDCVKYVLSCDTFILTADTCLNLITLFNNRCIPDNSVNVYNAAIDNNKKIIEDYLGIIIAEYLINNI